MKSHGATTPPKYEDIEVPSQPGTFRSKVTFTTKHMLQSRPSSSKKEAEKDAARNALKQLGVADWETLSNPKGKLLEMYPKAKPVFIPEDIVETKQFQSTLVLAPLEDLNEVVVNADEYGKTKKEAQRSVAKKVLEWLNLLQEGE